MMLIINDIGTNIQEARLDRRPILHCVRLCKVRSNRDNYMCNTLISNMLQTRPRVTFLRWHGSR